MASTGRRNAAALAAMTVLGLMRVALAASCWDGSADDPQERQAPEEGCSFGYTETSGRHAGERFRFFRAAHSDTLLIRVVYTQPRSNTARRPAIDIMAANRHWRPKLVSWDGTGAAYALADPADLLAALEGTRFITIHEAAYEGEPYGTDWLVDAEGLPAVLASWQGCLEGLPLVPELE
jgi:hypothetical protein